MPIDQDVLRAAGQGAAAGMAAGVGADQFARSGYAPPFMQYSIRAPGSDVAQFALDHPVAMPILRGLSLAIPLAVIAGAIKAGKTGEGFNEFFGKRAEEKPFWEYLYQNADDIEKEANAYLDQWSTGFVKACRDNNLEPEEVFNKQAQALVQPGVQAPAANGSALGTAWDITKYMLPGVGTAYMAGDTVQSMKDMLRGGASWKDRLWAAARTLGNAGFTALSVIPGLGIVGGGARGLASMAKGMPRVAALLNKVSKGSLGAGEAYAKGLHNIAQKGGITGGAAKALGFGDPRFAKPVWETSSYLKRPMMEGLRYRWPMGLLMGGIAAPMVFGGGEQEAPQSPIGPAAFALANQQAMGGARSAVPYPYQ